MFFSIELSLKRPGTEVEGEEYQRIEDQVVEQAQDLRCTVVGDMVEPDRNIAPEEKARRARCDVTRGRPPASLQSLSPIEYRTQPQKTVECP
ncbi:Uncharacterised protein [Serratia quinivorans]|uniref:hypothetical protein n=1 Tax=Serratia quinivorans TaxID=137545 RepID=UPI002179A7C4|nr:hypothetical protein [Serratia quinivorans]CAI1695771.1 Uncharacterised protein [Serratia quinivorans]